MKYLAIIALLFLNIALLVLPSQSFASHSWGGYHWARTANPFTLQLGDNLASAWDPYIGTTSTDWSVSTVLDTNVVSGNRNPKSCKATSGRVEVCNAKYGNNGWLGLAQIWTYGLHITQGVVKVNDTYFTTPRYNTPAWKNLVMCQEVGHTLGLDHQDENFTNSPLGSCMDYTSDPTPNQHPNQHDYDELALIYEHLDGFTTVGPSSRSSAKNDISNEDVEDQSKWGRKVKAKGKTAVFERDFGGGQKVFTFVIFTE